MPIIAPKLSLLNRIAGGMIILSVLLLSFPILASLLPSECINDVCTGNVGYYISVSLTFIIGLVNSLAQNSMIALAAQEGGSLCGLYWIATGLSGLSMAILSIILTAIFPPKGDSGVTLTSTIIFFVFASLISILAIYLTYKYV